MELLVLLSLCLLTFIGKTFGDDSIKITIKEDEDVILNCSFGTDITGHRIEWKKVDKDVFYFDFTKEDPTVEDPKFKDRVSRFSKDLKSGDASVKIKGAKVSDSGKYHCLHINKPGKAPGPEDQRLIELTVVACRKPNIRTTKVKDGVQVNCTARCVSLISKMELKNSAGDTVYAKDPTDDDITLLAVMTKEDHYHCVLTQEEICHKHETEPIFVPSGSVIIREGEDVILPCHLGINLRAEHFDWKKMEQTYFCMTKEKCRIFPHPFVIVSVLLIVAVIGIVGILEAVERKEEEKHPVNERIGQQDAFKTAAEL